MKVVIALTLCLLGLSVGFEDKTVVQWLMDNGFNTLVTALNVSNLAGVLSQSGPFTIFAPTEAAFEKLGFSAISDLLLDPPRLALILQYHVVKEFVLVPMINGPVVKDTENGEQLNLAPSAGGLVINNQAFVSASANDIIVNNGAIQPIDAVLMPANLPSFTITQFLLMDDARFSDLFQALYFAGLSSAFDGRGDFTLFAPVDTAFSPLNGNLLDPNQADAQSVYATTFRHHVVPGGRLAEQLTNGQILYTLHGSPLIVTIDSSGVKINNASVLDTDLRCTNGVIHAIDTILFPPTSGNSP